MSDGEAWQVTDDAAVLYEQSFVPAIFAPAAVTVADAAGIGRGDRVLDVGCGTGALAREAARRVGREGRVVGLDLNPLMLEVARSEAPEIEWRQGDAADLPYEDGAFDVVASQFALMFFPDPARRAAGDVARPGAGRPARGRGLRPDGERARVRRARPGRGAGLSARRGRAVAVAVRAGGQGRGWQRSSAAPGSRPPRSAPWRVPVRFPSIDALVHTEVKASPIRDVIDEPSFDALLEGAREALARWCEDGGAIGFPLPTHILTARKA